MAKPKRAIDQNIDNVQKWLSTKLIFINKTRIKSWQGLFIIAFIAGVLATLIWSIPSGYQQKSMAAGEEGVLLNTTFDCPERTITSTGQNICDGLDVIDRYSANGTHDTQITSAANNPSGQGGRGYRHWIGTTVNNHSSAFRADFSEGQDELWVRWYARYQEGFSWAGIASHKVLYYWGSSAQWYYLLYPHEELTHDLDTIGIQINGLSGPVSYSYRTKTNGWATTQGGRTADGNWDSYEAYTKINSQAGVADGILRIWINGILVLENEAVDYRTSSAPADGLVRNIDIGQNHNVAANPTPYYEDFDDIKIVNEDYNSFVQDAEGNLMIGTINVSECVENQTQTCSTGQLGICSAGIQTCTNGAWSTCTRTLNPTTEICGNNIDEDCNGSDLACPACSQGQIVSRCTCGSTVYSTGYCCNNVWSSSACVCTPSWQCTTWSACLNNIQTRTCTDVNNCGVSTDKPAELQSCSSSSGDTNIFSDTLKSGATIPSGEMQISTESPYQGTASLKIIGTGSWKNSRIQNLNISGLSWSDLYLEFSLKFPVSIGYAEIHLWVDGVQRTKDFSVSPGAYQTFKFPLTDFASTGSSISQLMIGANWGSSTVYLDEIKIISVSTTNHPPTFTSTVIPELTLSMPASTNSEYIRATDPDAGDTVTITIENKPSWLNIVNTQTGNPASLEVSYNLDADDVGDYNFTVVATDSHRERTEHAMLVHLVAQAPAPAQPVITNIQKLSTYYYNISWEQTADTTHYELYELGPWDGDMSNGSDWVKIATIDNSTQTSYSVTRNQEGAYFYFVAAYNGDPNSDGAPSEFSWDKVATYSHIISPDKELNEPTLNITPNPGSNEVTIGWQDYGTDSYNPLYLVLAYGPVGKETPMNQYQWSSTNSASFNLNTEGIYYFAVKVFMGFPDNFGGLEDGYGDAVTSEWGDKIYSNILNATRPATPQVSYQQVSGSSYQISFTNVATPIMQPIYLAKHTTPGGNISYEWLFNHQNYNVSLTETGQHTISVQAWKAWPDYSDSEAVSSEWGEVNISR